MYLKVEDSDEDTLTFKRCGGPAQSALSARDFQGFQSDWFDSIVNKIIHRKDSKKTLYIKNRYESVRFSTIFKLNGKFPRSNFNYDEHEEDAWHSPDSYDIDPADVCQDGSTFPERRPATASAGNAKPILKRQSSAGPTRSRGGDHVPSAAGTFLQSHLRQMRNNKIH